MWTRTGVCVCMMNELRWAREPERATYPVRGSAAPPPRGRARRLPSLSRVGGAGCRGETQTGESRASAARAGRGTGRQDTPRSPAAGEKRETRRYPVKYARRTVQSCRRHTWARRLSVYFILSLVCAFFCRFNCAPYTCLAQGKGGGLTSDPPALLLSAILELTS